ncbi:MAG: hypothetical protein P4L51_19355 [Puia sp.]|nr:hypothetical protein [Puia sp.]
MLHKKFNSATLSFSLLFVLSAFTGLRALSQSDRKDLAYNTSNAMTARLHADPVQVTISQSDSADLKFRIHILNPEEQKVTIYIRSKALGTIFVRTLSDSEFFNHEYANLFNLNELEDGQYSIEVVSAGESVRKDIRINTITKVDRKASIN